MRPVKKGDIVDIIAPSGSFNPQDISKICQYIENLGLIPRIASNILGGDITYHANSDEERTHSLIKALTASDSKIIWCVRGGYGAARLIPELEKFSSFTQQKLFIGFSDITALHVFLTEKWGWKTVHGPMLKQLISDNQISKQSESELISLIFGSNNKTILSLKSLNSFDESSIKGKLVGGNLEVLKSSIGTNWQIDTKDKILIFEEVNEQSYRLDRSLNHLLQANIITAETKAVVVADITPTSEETNANINKTIQRFADNTPCPVFRLEGIGHNNENYPIVINSETEIIVDNKAIKFHNYFNLFDSVS